MRRGLVVLALALAAAGCGGAAPRPAPPPKVPRDLAQTWASQADAIAAAVSAGDDCHAAQFAAVLRGEVQGDAAQIPAPLRAQLLSTVSDLAGRIVCTLPPVQPPPPGDQGNGKGHGKGHGKGPGGDNGGGDG